MAMGPSGTSEMLVQFLHGGKTIVVPGQSGIGADPFKAITRTGAATFTITFLDDTTRTVTVT